MSELAESILKDYAKEIAKAGLGIKAVKLNTKKPFQWASGYHMPIYNDNRMFLWYPEHRQLIAETFQYFIASEELKLDFIAGTSTAGIAPATTLADRIKKPVIYIRDKPKDHGMKNQIEGIDAEKDLEGRAGIVVEDLISTGGSSANAVLAVRNAKGAVDLCISIFNYGLAKAKEEFDKINCRVWSALSYDVILETAVESNYITKKDLKDLEEWRADPFGWGEKHGFPKVEKGDKK
jgi:orotate phosphoribosyltransferase